MNKSPAEVKLAELERKLEVPEGLFFRLRDEAEDWSFLIKVQALIEASLDHLIKRELNRPELHAFIEKLGYNGRLGKLELIRSLKLLDKVHFDYLDLLAKFRNDMAHDIRFVGFKLSDYLDKKSDEKFREVIIRASCLPKDFDLKINKKIRAQMLSNPKLYFWIGAMNCLTQVYLHDQAAERRELMEGLFGLERGEFSLSGGLGQLATADLSEQKLGLKGLLG